MLINFMGYQITRIIDWKKIEGKSTTNGKKKLVVDYNSQKNMNSRKSGILIARDKNHALYTSLQNQQQNTTRKSTISEF